MREGEKEGGREVKRGGLGDRERPRGPCTWRTDAEEESSTEIDDGNPPPPHADRDSASLVSCPARDIEVRESARARERERERESLCLVSMP